MKERAMSHRIGWHYIKDYSVFYYWDSEKWWYRYKDNWLYHNDEEWIYFLNTNLKWRIVSIMGKRAIVRIGWLKSPSLDVTTQEVHFHVLNDPENVGPQVVDVGVGANHIDLNLVEKATVFAKVVVSDGTHTVESDQLQFTVDDLEVPMPPTNLSWEVVSIVGEDA